MKNSKDPRHLSRVLAFQKLFQIFFNKDLLDQEKNSKKSGISDKELLKINEAKKYDKELLTKLVDGVLNSQKETDKIIRKYAPQWEIEQMSKTDIQIMRIAVWEGFIGEITPQKVAIDEAIEIAKEFGGEKSSVFVNGVLGALINDYKEKKKK